MARILAHITPMLSVKNQLPQGKIEECLQAKEAQKIRNLHLDLQVEKCLQLEPRPLILPPLLSLLHLLTEVVPILQQLRVRWTESCKCLLPCPISSLQDLGLLPLTRTLRSTSTTSKTKTKFCKLWTKTRWLHLKCLINCKCKLNKLKKTEKSLSIPTCLWCTRMHQDGNTILNTKNKLTSN